MALHRVGAIAPAVCNRIWDHLPWRVRRRLTRAYYVEQVTQRFFHAVLATRPVRVEKGSSVEVLSLLDKPNLKNYLLGIKSLFGFSGAAPAVTVLSDGSLDAGDKETLERHVVGIRVFTMGDIQLQESESAAVVEQWCRAYSHLRKLVYLPFLAQRPFLLFLDSDIIFRRPLPDTFLRLPDGISVTYNQDHDHSRYDPHFHYLLTYGASRNLKLVTNLNCGMMLWNRSELRPLDTMDFLAYLVRNHGRLHGVSEQDAWSLLASQTQSQPLPTDYLVLSNWAMNTPERRRDARAIHYVSGHRYRSFEYLRDGMNVIRLLRD